jgi:hypothetical protein
MATPWRSTTFLIDDLVYRVYSNMGRRALTQLRPGMFGIFRIVPVHPAIDAWLVSGHVVAYRKSDRRRLAQVAVEQVTAHPEVGLTYYRDFGRLDDLFADPHRPETAPISTTCAGTSMTTRSRRWRSAASCQRHPDGADPVFRALLRKPGFCWSRDGEKLLRREKQSHFDREPTPSISTVGQRLAELLGVSVR